MKSLLIVLMLSLSAQAADFYLCKEVNDPEYGFLLRTTDKPVSYKRFTAMMKPFQVCGFASDKEWGCRGGGSDDAFEQVFDCDKKTISLYKNLDGEVRNERRRHHPRRPTVDYVRCDRLTYAEFARERTQLSHCKN